MLYYQLSRLGSLAVARRQKPHLFKGGKSQPLSVFIEDSTIYMQFLAKGQQGSNDVSIILILYKLNQIIMVYTVISAIQEAKAKSRIHLDIW